MGEPQDDPVKAATRNIIVGLIFLLLAGFLHCLMYEREEGNFLWFQFLFIAAYTFIMVRITRSFIGEIADAMAKEKSNAAEWERLARECLDRLRAVDPSGAEDLAQKRDPPASG